MTIAATALAEGSIALAQSLAKPSKAPPKRTVQAVTERVLIPEAR